VFGLRAVEECRGIGLVLRFLGVLSCTEILIQDCSVDWFRVQCPISGSVRVVCLAWLFVGPGMWVIGLVPGFRVDGGVGVWSVLGIVVGLNRISPAGFRFRSSACRIRVVSGGDIRRKSLEFRGFACMVDDACRAGGPRPVVSRGLIPSSAIDFRFGPRGGGCLEDCRWWLFAAGCDDCWNSAVLVLPVSWLPCAGISSHDRSMD
jgi:hypothetical protein